MNWFCKNWEIFVTEPFSLVIVFLCAYAAYHYKQCLTQWEKFGLYGVCVSFAFVFLATIIGEEIRPIWTKIIIRGAFIALSIKWIYRLATRAANMRAGRDRFDDQIPHQKLMAMTKFPCEDCRTDVAEYKDGELIIFCHAFADGHRVPLNDVLEAMAKEETGLRILRKFYEQNETVKFIVK